MERLELIKTSKQRLEIYQKVLEEVKLAKDTNTPSSGLCIRLKEMIGIS
jgi:hypothetical protein